MLKEKEEEKVEKCKGGNDKEEEETKRLEEMEKLIEGIRESLVEKIGEIHQE